LIISAGVGQIEPPTQGFSVFEKKPSYRDKFFYEMFYTPSIPLYALALWMISAWMVEIQWKAITLFWTNEGSVLPTGQPS
jgi:hypothetical protein